MKLFEYKGKDVEIFWLNPKSVIWLMKHGEKRPGFLGRGDFYYDCPHVYYNCLFFQIWISGF